MHGDASSPHRTWSSSGPLVPELGPESIAPRSWDSALSPCPGLRFWGVGRRMNRHRG